MITLRRPQSSDLIPLSQLFDDYRAFYKQARKPQAAQVFISERLERKDSVLFVAEKKGTLIGFTQLYPSFSSVAMKKLWILNDLYVAPAERGQGAAKALLAQAVSFAKMDGAKGLTLNTAMDNHEAQKLYESTGWKPDKNFQTFNYNFSSL